jgi:hypothetical protein
LPSATASPTSITRSPVPTSAVTRCRFNSCSRCTCIHHIDDHVSRCGGHRQCDLHSDRLVGCGLDRGC